MLFVWMLCVCLSFCTSGLAFDKVKPEPSPVLAIASKVLDENITDRERIRLIRSRPEFAADLLQSLVEDIEPGTDKEKSRIPWLWEIAVVAAEQNNRDILARILDVSLPVKDTPISDWQVAVIGGGIIFELSNRGINPKTRIEEIVGNDTLLRERWDSLLKTSRTIALDEHATGGIRYDSFRVFAMSEWKSVKSVCNEIFSTRTANESNQKEVRLAAISALADIKNDEVADFLLNRFPLLNSYERERACLVLLRSDKTAKRLLNSLEKGTIARVDIPKRITSKFLRHASVLVRQKAAKFFLR